MDSRSRWLSRSQLAWSSGLTPVLICSGSDPWGLTVDRQRRGRGGLDPEGDVFLRAADSHARDVADEYVVERDADVAEPRVHALHAKRAAGDSLGRDVDLLVDAPDDLRTGPAVVAAAAQPYGTSAGTDGLAGSSAGCGVSSRALARPAGGPSKQGQDSRGEDGPDNQGVEQQVQRHGEGDLAKGRERDDRHQGEGRGQDRARGGDA